MSKQYSSHGSVTRPDSSITITSASVDLPCLLKKPDPPNLRSCYGKSWKPTLPAGAFLVKPNCRVPERLKCGKSISSALSTKWSIMMPCCLVYFHIVGLSIFTSHHFYHIDANTLQFTTAAARVVHSLPCAGCPEFQVMGDVANLLNARFAPKRPREMTSRPIDRP